MTPERYTAGRLPDFDGLHGPAVELSFWNGENSGRDEVAEVFSRLFPFKRRFILDVARTNEMLGYVRHSGHGRYVADRTVRLNRVEVDFTTPPHHEGMGTLNSRLGPGADPIVGAAFLAKSNGVDSVVLLRLRLPRRLRFLPPAILDVARQTQADLRR